MKTPSILEQAKKSVINTFARRSSNVEAASKKTLSPNNSPRLEQESADRLSRIYGLKRWRVSMAAVAVGSMSLALIGAKQAAAVSVSSLNCQTWSVTGALTDPCTVTLSGAAPSSGLTVKLSSSNGKVTVPASVTVPANSTSTWFNATAASVSSAQSATLTASASSTSATTYLQLNASSSSSPALKLSTSDISFGNVALNTTVAQSVTLTASGGSVTIDSLTINGTGFKQPSATLPTTLSSGQSLTLSVRFDPTKTGAVTGELAFATSVGTSTVSLSGTGGSSTTSVAVSVNPSSATVDTGTTQQFAASITGSSNTSVTWSVSGGGTISSSGVYTAPASVPSPATVTVKAISAADSSKSASASVTIAAPVTTTGPTGSTYYLSPSGSDSNSGLSSSDPWLTPNHSLKCGDQIIAAASSSYNSANFANGKWGTVSCSSGNSVAWLKCASFDACKITSGSGIMIDKSYWGVTGWEVTSTTTYTGCFVAAPNNSNPTEIHHIIFANNVANGCQDGGFITYNNGNASVDYVSIVGNIAYNGARGSQQCYSGISLYEPIMSDSNSGTHIYVAGNFSYANIEPSTCAGSSAPGADGIIFDTFDGDQENLPTQYHAQAVAENNILLGNNGNGFAIQNNSTGSTHAPVYVRNNTSWGNNVNDGTTAPLCSEIEINVGQSTQITNNIAMTNLTKSCGGYTVDGINVYEGGTSDVVDNNFIYTVGGVNTYTYGSGSFVYGSNTTSENPQFANPTVPGAPSCSGSANVPACMSSVVANFTPKNSSAASFGYQKPSSTPVSDSLFPQWLCTSSLPEGLVTMGCAN